MIRRIFPLMILLLVSCTSASESSGLDGGPEIYSIHGPLVSLEQDGIYCLGPDRIDIEVTIGEGILTRPDLECTFAEDESSWRMLCQGPWCFDVFGSCIWYDDVFDLKGYQDGSGELLWGAYALPYFYCERVFDVTVERVQ